MCSWVSRQDILHHTHTVNSRLMPGPIRTYHRGLAWQKTGSPRGDYLRFGIFGYTRLQAALPRLGAVLLPRSSERRAQTQSVADLINARRLLAHLTPPARRGLDATARPSRVCRFGHHEAAPCGHGLVGSALVIASSSCQRPWLPAHLKPPPPVAGTAQAGPPGFGTLPPPVRHWSRHPGTSIFRSSCSSARRRRRQRRRFPSLQASGNCAPGHQIMGEHRWALRASGCRLAPTVRGGTARRGAYTD